MSQSVSFYRKYRSRSLDDLVGQDHITKTLKQAFKTGALSHAYLLTGPHGVGKTSTARIIAHEANKIEYTDDSTAHLDIIEIDAASNRRIEEVRELRDKIHIAPTQLSYKVYIIDEVHMLTNEAFNALLKTLEEPPEHALFILATTEVHKLPATIVSRTQRFSFRPIAPADMQEHLAYIAQQENIKITQDALEAVAEHAQGSFRDAISLLDQIATTSSEKDKIDLEQVHDLIGLASTVVIDSLAKLITSSSDIEQVFTDIDGLYARGVSVQALASQLAKHLRSVLMSHDRQQQARLLTLVQDLLHLHASVDPKLKLQTTLALFMLNNHGFDGQDVYGPTRKQPSTPQQSSPQPSQDISKLQDRKQTSANAKKPADEKPTKPKKTPAASSLVSPETVINSWARVLEQVKSQAPAMHAALRQASTEANGLRLVLHFQYPLHQRKVKQQHNFTQLQEAIESVVGGNVEIECVISKSKSPAAKPPVTDAINPNVQDDSSLEKLRGALGGEIVQLS